MKGALSGMAAEGVSNDKILERAAAVGMTYKPSAYPFELYSLSGKLGAQMRATVTEFGPVLLSKILELNDVPSSVLMVLFKYADDKELPVVDLNDLKKVLNYLSEGSGAAEIKENYGKISPATAGTILRKIVALEQQGINQIFGEKSFDIEDLMEKVDAEELSAFLMFPMFSSSLPSFLLSCFRCLPNYISLFRKLEIWISPNWSSSWMKLTCFLKMPLKPLWIRSNK